MHSFIPKKTDINPYLYYKKCRDCKSEKLSSSGKKGFCRECNWHFFVHTVEELQDSHSRPSFLKLYELGLGEFYDSI